MQCYYYLVEGIQNQISSPPAVNHQHTKTVSSKDNLWFSSTVQQTTKQTRDVSADHTRLQSNLLVLLTDPNSDHYTAITHCMVLHPVNLWGQQQRECEMKRKSKAAELDVPWPTDQGAMRLKAHSTRTTVKTIKQKETWGDLGRRGIRHTRKI